jgi:hypothetical protein
MTLFSNFLDVCLNVDAPAAQKDASADNKIASKGSLHYCGSLGYA